MSWTEREIVNSMRDQVLQGPQEYCGVQLVQLCISPVGVRWNDAAKYFEYRDPSQWLSEHMCARCAGLPVIAGAIDGTLNSKEFGKRVVGTVMIAYPLETNLMCVARRHIVQ